MARRVILSDDLTGNESEDVKTYDYMVSNVFYQIDLSDDSFEKFEKAIARFVKVSRETRRITSTAKGEANLSERIRQWAKANGHEVGEKGRLSAEIIAAYHEANSNSQTDTNQGETDSPKQDETDTKTMSDSNDVNGEPGATGTDSTSN